MGKAGKKRRGKQNGKGRKRENEEGRSDAIPDVHYKQRQTELVKYLNCLD